MRRCVDLKPTVSGTIGLCPFHDDHHPGVGVNDEGNYWYCFAGCGGGSVIGCWMRWRACDFTAAITELAEMLLQRFDDRLSKRAYVAPFYST